MIQHLIFQPNLCGVKPNPSKIIPLDRHTPRGLFLGNGGNRYLVCDDTFCRFAVVLQHAEMRPFTTFELGQLSVETGTYHGVGKVHLGDPDEQEGADLPTGTIEIDDDLLLLHVRNLWGKAYLQPIVYGFANLAAGVFSEWSLMVADHEPFFGMGPGDGSIQ